MPFGQGVAIWTKSFLAIHNPHPALHRRLFAVVCSSEDYCKGGFFMSILLRNFAFSAKEFKSIKSIVAAALLIALHTVLAVFVSIQEHQHLEFQYPFLPTVQ